MVDFDFGKRGAISWVNRNKGFEAGYLSIARAMYVPGVVEEWARKAQGYGLLFNETHAEYIAGARAGLYDALYADWDTLCLVEELAERHDLLA